MLNWIWSYVKIRFYNTNYWKNGFANIFSIYVILYYEKISKLKILFVTWILKIIIINYNSCLGKYLSISFNNFSQCNII